MDAAQITDAFAGWRKRHARHAWKPLAATHGEKSLSYFGGEPSCDPGPWPSCTHCKAAMRLFLQLDLATLPPGFAAPLRDGLLQLFYCSTDDGACETWSAFSGAHQVLVVPKDGPAAPRSPVDPLPVVVIQGWERFDDFPHPEEHQALGVHYDYDFKRKRVSVTCDDPPLSLRELDSDLDVAELISQPAAGDKLGGWPHWIQSVEYPSCTVCGSEMSLLMQIDSEDHLAHMFGDTGCAHLTYCPQHPTVMAFGWACS